MIILAMWLHVTLNAMVVHEEAQTPHNPIWGELRTLLAILTTAALWLTLWAAHTGVLG